jgi:mannose/fructose/N-acetylgalactosamine-specific phosphotransferase system component IID
MIMLILGHIVASLMCSGIILIKLVLFFILWNCLNFDFENVSCEIFDQISANKITTK